MTKRFSIHPDTPQRRLISQAAEILRAGGLIVYPTDSCYAIGCSLDTVGGAREIARIRKTDKNHNFTLVCRDLSEIAIYAKVPNWAYRVLKASTPGPYTFILQATRDVPKRLQNLKRKTIGIRIPDHPVPMGILAELGSPLMSSTLLMPGDEQPMNDGEQILERLNGQVDLVIDSGSCGLEPSSVVDLTGNFPVVLRHGLGDTSHLD